ncbi:hypothetical protein HETIRDRAFT_322855 [Heterobasidion irregulare TC 32-1]|uniref:CCHC-type domain-containing protein n=1 Tax=Heterobasidion irregulare (strain TC 32-1) TaxID=747525 RepID=W4K289_HETIT|nr:uncharacterized protein HETIRDRAFT_322855 [Heterobasidion irregulare TC 32-1]ETW79917.1 hypothetical protein HETIRDRAFT_322855 [Heterobasidion irregulare TC 32-1]
MAPPTMPARGDRSAPTFDPSRPRTLRRYFADLDFHFVHSAVNSDLERKRHACRFADLDTSDLWESLPTFSDHAKTYQDFCDSVYKLYPGADDDRRWLVADLHSLVGMYSRIGIGSLGDLGVYYRRFLAIALFLRQKNRISEVEEGHTFAQGFQTKLWVRILQRLQIKLPDHFPDDPYCLDDIYDAARFVLHGTTTSFAPPLCQSIMEIGATAVQSGDLGTTLTRIAESFGKALSSAISFGRPHAHPARCQRCSFCGLTGHFIAACPSVLEYVRIGKCIRNSENKVVLSSGCFVPHRIKGRTLRDRIDEWYRCNPQSNAMASLELGTDFQSRRSAPIISNFGSPSLRSPGFTGRFACSNRIAALEDELCCLRKLSCPMSDGRTDVRKPAERSRCTILPPLASKHHPLSLSPDPKSSAPFSRRSECFPLSQAAIGHLSDDVPSPSSVSSDSNHPVVSIFSHSFIPPSSLPPKSSLMHVRSHQPTFYRLCPPNTFPNHRSCLCTSNHTCTPADFARFQWHRHWSDHIGTLTALAHFRSLRRTTGRRGSPTAFDPHLIALAHC